MTIDKLRRMEGDCYRYFRKESHGGWGHGPH